MKSLLSSLPLASAQRAPDATALTFGARSAPYAELAAEIEGWARALAALGAGKLDRIAIYLPKQIETVVAFFGTAHAGCIFVPVNPLLKGDQVGYILRDCNVTMLVTSRDRGAALAAALPACPDLRHVVFVDGPSDAPSIDGCPELATHNWSELVKFAPAAPSHRVIDTDVVSIFYTSGSTGKPKGVVLSHRNMVAGAESVASYLSNTSDDRLLAVLPFSFDYGFSQLSTSFLSGASVVMMDYLFPRDVIALADKARITGLAGVPPLWAQLADLPWPDGVRSSLRYITNSGGAMPVATLRKLRTSLPNTQPFLMYGLTEAFRSTYLPPAEVDRRPESMGKAIPNAEIMVVRPDGTPCAPDEPGELVHRGPLVSLGYWNDPAKTAERFKPVPKHLDGLVLQEMAVWSGDTVRMDQDGFLYFVGRRDEMIKTSGYRVSPTEVEEVAFASGRVADAAACGVPHPTLGQAIVLFATAASGHAPDTDALIAIYKREVPAYMVPHRVEWREQLPRNPNGKYDRPKLALEAKEAFAGNSR